MRTDTDRGKIPLFLMLLMLLALVACGPNLTSTPSSNLPSYSGFPNIPSGSGSNAEPGTDGKSRPTPGGHTESIVAFGGLAYIGSDNGMLYAFEAQSGMIHWQHKLGGNVSVYAVANGVVYATSDNGIVYALNAISGVSLWHVKTRAYISQVQVAGGTVYVGSGAEADTSILYALKTADGSLLWQYSLRTQRPGLIGIFGGAVGTVYEIQVIDTGGPLSQALYALDASNGHVLWHTALEGNDGEATGTVALLNGIVYLATNVGSVYALHTDTGMRLWYVAQSSVPSGTSPAIPSLIIMNGIVYIGDIQNVAAFRASDGKRLWQYKIQEHGPFGAQLTIANGVIYFDDFSKGVIALRASDGTQLWQQRAGGPLMRPLTVENGLVINATGPIFALRASDGTQAWQSAIQGSGEGSLAGLPEIVGEGVVYIGGDDGIVHALRASDGKLLWQYKISELAVPTPPVYMASIQFTSSTSYDQALNIVANLGLKTAILCHATWVTQDEKASFPDYRSLLVGATVNSAPFWLDRLNATPGVAHAESVGNAISCPAMRPDNNPHFLPSEQANTFLRVTFSDTTQYPAAIEAMNGLGFRMADPCYEQARAQDKKPTWHLMGEVDSFGQTHTLVLATTTLNAITWIKQLQTVGGVGGVVKVETPFKATC